MNVFVGHKGVPGGPLGSQGRPRGVSVTSQGGPGGVPWGARGVPEVPGACPGDPWDPRGVQGRPGYPQDPFHKDGSVLESHDIIPQYDSVI